jgi:hypothetical protein
MLGEYMTEKKTRYAFDGVYKGCYVRAWAEGKGRNKEIMVQVWKSGKAEGEPDGDWAMPGILPVTPAMDQAILQT